MNIEEKNYLNLLENIIKNGKEKTDRTGVGTKSIFGTQLRFSLSDNKIPLLTTKKTFIKGVIEELLFFLRGDSDTKVLESKGVNIWKGNTSREFLDKIGLNNLPEGSLGRGYGVQWRDWNYNGTKIDQIKNLINDLKNNPNSRRLMVSAWNVGELNLMALPPCHYNFQCYVEDNKLSLMWNQRSVDSFLGLPFNIASYAILIRILCKITNLQPGELIFSGGDTHVYLNHLEQVKEQISREPYDFPEMEIKKEISSVDDINLLSYDDFVIKNYKSHPAIKAEMAI